MREKFLSFYNETDKKFILLMIFLNLPMILSEFFMHEITFKIIRHTLIFLAEVIFMTIFFAVTISFLAHLNKKVANFFKYTLILVSAIIFSADIFTVFYYDTPINRTILRIILATNPHEASEFFSTYVLNFKFLIIFFVAIIIFIAICKISLPKINEKILAIFLIIIVVAVVRPVKKDFNNFIISANSIGRISLFFSEVLSDMRNYENLIANQKRELTLTRNESDLPLVIFILGESATRNHMQIYGYKNPTTPFLDKLKSEGELKIFSDTVSPHAHTMHSLQKMFTFYRRENSDDDGKLLLDKENIFKILNAAGYYTAWISNQEMGGIYGNIGRFYSEICKTRKFTQPRDSESSDNSYFDEKLLPLLDEELKSAYEKKFFVLHLMGSHGRYLLRYPKEFEKFFPENYSDKNREEAEEIAEYDNSILYTDSIINKIIERVKDLDAVVIYISDHGEEVFEYRNFVGHAEDNPSKFMFEIPFVIYTSPKFRQIHPEVENKIVAAVDKPFMSDDMIHFLLDMMKIETPDFNKSLSPLNENYNSTRKRIFGGKIYTKGNGLK